MARRRRLDKIISVRLGAVLYAELEGFAAEQDITVAELARLALGTVAMRRALSAGAAEAA